MTEEKWKLVPAEPTQEMLAAGCKAALSTNVLLDDTRFACETACWNAMLGASPKPPIYGHIAVQTGETEIIPSREKPLVFYSCLQHAARVDPTDSKIAEKIGPDGFIAGGCPFCHPAGEYTKG